MTDLAKLFFLAPSWSRDGFRPINLDPGSGFSENPEKTILAGNSKILLQNLRIFMSKIAEMIVTTMINERLYKFSNIFSSEVDGQSPP